MQDSWALEFHIQLKEAQEMAEIQNHRYRGWSKSEPNFVKFNYNVNMTQYYLLIITVAISYVQLHS